MYICEIMNVANVIEFEKFNLTFTPGFQDFLFEIKLLRNTPDYIYHVLTLPSW